VNRKPTDLGELRRQHAEQLSVPEERVGLVTLDLQILRETGTFVAIHTRGLTMFTTQATAWQELGVPVESARHKQYRPPAKDLIDSAIIAWFRKHAESARHHLNTVGIAVDFMRPYRWIGYSDWGGWLAEFERRQQEWNEYRDEEIIARYDEHLQRLIDLFTPSAREAYEALRAAGVEKLGRKDDFVGSVVAHALASMPTPEYIWSTLLLEYDVPALVTPDLLEEELRRHDRVRHEREMERVRAEAELEKQRAEAQIERERLTEEQRAAMFQQRLERYQQQALSLAMPLEQVLGALLGEIEQTCRDMLTVLDEHGGLRGRSGERLRRLSERVKILDEFGHGQLLEIVQQAGGLTRAAAGETEDQTKARLAVLESTLQQIQKVVAAGERARGALKVVAEEVETKRFRSLCLACRHVWDSEGSVEPLFCANTRCKSSRVASRELAQKPRARGEQHDETGS
jgi:hypothetical protein